MRRVARRAATRRMWLMLGIAWALAACGGRSQPASQTSNEVQTLSVLGFEQALAQGGVQLVDVRTAAEYAEGHLEGAVLIDVNSSTFLSDAQQQLDPRCPVALYCLRGKRSQKAVQQLADRGYEVLNLEGGIAAWRQAGKPVVP